MKIMLVPFCKFEVNNKLWFKYLYLNLLYFDTSSTISFESNVISTGFMIDKNLGHYFALYWMAFLYVLYLN